MKINRLTASFGKLSNETMTFHDGLNIIEAPNESGKTTWCAFISAMLFGIDSSERARTGYLPDKQKYAPWSGAPMEGTMELTAGKKDITITRTTRLRSAPMREFSAVYTGTDTPVDGLDSDNAGEQLTGIKKEVFERSAFVGQGAAAVTGSPELEKRIASLFSTGEEGLSYSEADERLKSWQRKRKFNRRGMLPETENDIAHIRGILDDMHSSSGSLKAMEEQLRGLKNESGDLETSVARSQKQRRDELLAGIKAAGEERDWLAGEYNKALGELNDSRNAMRRSVFSNRSEKEAENEALNDAESLKKLYAVRRVKSSSVWAVICFVLSLVCAVIYSYYFSHWALIAGACAFGISAVVLLMRFSVRRRMASEAKEKIKIILKKYEAAKEGDISARLEEYRELCAREKKAEREERLAREKYNEASSFLTELERQALEALDYSDGSSETAVLTRKLREKQHEVIRLTTDIASENGRLRSLGDPLILKGELIRLEDRKRTLTEEYEALRIAIETLKQADDEIQSRFSPELGKATARYMSEATGGKYDEIMLNRDFTAKVKSRDDVIARESEYLSAGTADLLYLAVRLAVCELALPDGESCPLIIDDALVNLDETRFNQVMKLLREIAKDRQVILFTCRK